MTILAVNNLVKRFPGAWRALGRRHPSRLAVDNVSFDVDKGETLALVGESGAGKSTTGRLVLRLIEPDSGSVVFEGQDVLALSKEEMRKMRTQMQIIFQDPFGSLDPRRAIGESVAEPLRVHTDVSRGDRIERAAALLGRVGIGTQFLNRYPAHLSGGQLQRVAIARALTLDPKLIVCDEPVAALDVSVRAQVLNLLKDLQEESGVSYLFISHDLALVEVIADRVAVMRHGEIVEVGSREMFVDPQHPYTRELLAAIPKPTSRRRRAAGPSSMREPAGVSQD